MSDCIEFQGCRLPSGYGKRTYSGKSELAHRVAYCEASGCSLASIAGVVVRHTCDNPPCCNPEHLILGTKADNSADMVARSRGVWHTGEQHGRARLTAENVAFIRTNYVKADREFGQTALSRRFGVGIAAINKVVAGRTWK